MHTLSLQRYIRKHLGLTLGTTNNIVEFQKIRNVPLSSETWIMHGSFTMANTLQSLVHHCFILRKNGTYPSIHKNKNYFNWRVLFSVPQLDTHKTFLLASMPIEGRKFGQSASKGEILDVPATCDVKLSR